MNIITEAEQFYGYLIGLQVERGAILRPGYQVSPKLYATFEYGSEASVWEVPDLKLFKILAEHLCQMAWARRRERRIRLREALDQESERPVARRSSLTPMANWYPISQKTVALLETPPEPGETHDWLPRIAGGLRRLLDAKTCFRFLRHCCDHYVHHRVVPDREICAAVDLAYGSPRTPGLKAYAWPEPDPELIARTIAETSAQFDAATDTKLEAAQVLPKLFRTGELICAGPDSQTALVRPLEESLADAHWQQFIVVNPMRGRQAINHDGEPSVRCQNNVLPRRHLVAEFDDLTLSKTQQARLISRLAQFVPLLMVVDSAGKSLHAWFHVEGVDVRDQARFFALACLLGADKHRWDTSGWLRMPGGLRRVEAATTIRQRIVFFHE